MNSDNTFFRLREQKYDEGGYLVLAKKKCT